MTTNITEIIVRNSGEVVLVEETAIGSSLALSRRSINPGDDYSGEVPRVVAICDLVHTEAYLGLPVNPSALADWDAFNAYMLSDATFKGYRDTVRPLDGDLTSALFTAYNRVASDGISAFSLVWGQWCSVSGITAEDRGVIANVAEGFNLPAEFVAIIRS